MKSSWNELDEQKRLQQIAGLLARGVGRFTILQRRTNHAGGKENSDLSQISLEVPNPTRLNVSHRIQG